MKTIIAAFMFVSFSAFSSVVTIQPGSSITLSADTTTTVTCQNGGGNNSQTRTACYCKFEVYGYSAHIRIDGVDMVMSSFNTNDDCLESLNKTPACR